jgi:hypothetical protein
MSSVGRTPGRFEGREARRPVVLLAVVLLTAGALGLLLLLLGPVAWLLAGDTVGDLPTGKEKANAINGVRTVLLQGAAGIAALVALWFTARTYQLSREGQVTDRFTKAVDQVAANTPDQQVGGVFALERIMRDSAKDHAAVVDVLSVFIRVHGARERLGGHSPGPEVRAALTVLARRPPRPQAEPDAIRLGEVNLGRTVLRGGRLDCVRLREATLKEAHWEGTRLQGAKLRGACLDEIDLVGADLGFASLRDATLRKARLRDARLDHANLTGASLERADLAGATLVGAHLAGVTGDPKLSDAQRAAAHCLPEAPTCQAAKDHPEDPCARYDW